MGAETDVPALHPIPPRRPDLAVIPKNDAVTKITRHVDDRIQELQAQVGIQHCDLTYQVDEAIRRQGLMWFRAVMVLAVVDILAVVAAVAWLR